MRYRRLPLLLVAVLFGGIAVDLPAQERGLNVPPEGFVAVFNGKDISGWKGLVGNPKTRATMSAEERAAAQERADESMRRHWSVVDGVLVFDGKGDNLCTANDYGNFELYVDWKIEPRGDSGIYLRGSPRVQIWDTGDGEGNRVGSGGLFNNQKNPSEPLVCADNPVGEWNTFYIMMFNNRVTVKLNGKLVTDTVVLENYWERDKPIYTSGAIELQNHGNSLYFRNIFLRELPPDPSPAWYVLFDGGNLDKWDFGERGWRVDRDGVLGRSQRFRQAEQAQENFIWTKERFGDFVLDLEYQLPAEGNSGILLRTDDRANWLHTGIEIQLSDSYGREQVGKQDSGAVYDVMAPRVNAAKPAGEWNHITIVAQDNLLSVVLNDKRIIDMNLNQWTEAHKNPDGTENKFNTAYRDMKREGFIGFQDHGTPVSFRNVQIKRLN